MHQQVLRRQRLPLILQAEAGECGLACLAMIAGFYGHETDLNSLRRRFPVSMKGLALKVLIDIAGRLGFSCRPVRVELDSLTELQLPAIVHWGMNHFVVLSKWKAGKFEVHDPAGGRRLYSKDELSPYFTGIALELTPSADFVCKKEVSRLRISELVGRIEGYKEFVAKAIFLSVLLHVLILVAPLYLQFAVDKSIAEGESSLLALSAVAFSLLYVMKFASEYVRSLVLVHFSGNISYRMGDRLFRHFIRLPLDWFEKRHIGDVVSRFSSTLPVRSFLTDGAVGVIVDGLMASLTLLVLYLYNALLASVVLAGVITCAVIRIATFRAVKEREEDFIRASAREQSFFMETARVVQGIKVLNMIPVRERLWRDRYANLISSRSRVLSLQSVLKPLSELVSNLEFVIVILLAAQFTIRGDFSVGMIFAFVAYRQQFVDKTSKLLDSGIQFRMLRLHLERIGDIVLSPKEVTETGGLVEHEVAGGISVKGVVYRYGEGEAPVLDGVDLDVAPGEFLAICGPSGGGKTTLIKILVGLLRPEEGKIAIDGVPLFLVGIDRYRQSIGAVLQDDQLMSGSIAENISAFSDCQDLARVEEYARLAGVHDEVMRMPMNYNTLVGDMGTTLSSGQRQRVLLARALYRRPRILFMDEGTSHLDLGKEREVNAALASLEITRVVIAHRPETIRAADRVVQLIAGRIA